VPQTLNINIYIILNYIAEEIRSECCRYSLRLNRKHFPVCINIESYRETVTRIAAVQQLWNGGTNKMLP
jgi:hypothetical protein